MENNEVLNNEVINLNVVAKSDANAKELTHSNELLAGLLNTYKVLSTAKYKMCGFIAQLNAVEAWKNYADVKSINQLVMTVTDCSKAYASELVKVANNFYLSDGTMKKCGTGLTFSDMKNLSDLEEPVRLKAIDLLNQLSSHTRANTEELCKYIKDGKSLDVLGVNKDKNKFLITQSEQTSEQPTGEQPTGEQPTGEQPTGEQPTGEQPTGEQPTGEQPTGEQTSEQPNAEVLTKANVETIFNDLLALEKDFEKESKSNLKKRLHEITIKLGKLSK